MESAIVQQPACVRYDALASSIVERDGSLTASELAKEGNVSVRTAQRWIRSLRESGRLDVSVGDAHQYVLRDVSDDADTT